MNKLQKGFRKWILRSLISYVNFISKHSRLVLLLMLPVLGVSGFYTFKLFSDIRTDIATLLPQEDLSVRHLRYIVDKTGGLGYLFVSVHSSDFATNKKVMKKIAQQVALLPSDLISGFEYNTNELERFFREHGLYYMQYQDLLSLKNILLEQISNMRLEFAGMLLEPVDPNINRRKIQRIIRKYNTDTLSQRFPDGYFATEDGVDLAMVINPVGSTNDVEFSRRLIAAFKKINDSVKAEFPEAHDLEIGISGVYVSLIENIINVVEDAIITGSLTFLLVFLSLYLYYRNLRILFIIATTVLSGVVVAFGISYFAIGYLNQLSVFLGAIIIGNSINFSIIQMARYFEERAKLVSLRRSILRTVVYTLAATGMAAFTASMAYGILSITKFQGFSKFGVMGGIGMVVGWLISYVLIPTLSIAIEKSFPLDPKRLESKKRDWLFTNFAGFIRKRSGLISLSLLVVVPLTLFFTVQYVSVDRMEYNTKNLGNRNMGSYGTEYYYNQRIEKVLGNRSAPAVLYAQDSQAAQNYAADLKKEILKQREQKSQDKELLGDVQWLDEILPKQQAQKQRLVHQMRAAFPEKYLSLLSKEDQKWGSQFLRMLKNPPVSIENLPVAVKRLFFDAESNAGNIFYVIPGKDVDLHNIRDLIEFGNAIKAKLPIEDDTIRMASESTIFSDIVVHVSHEGPLVTAIALVLVLILILLGSRNVKDFFLVSGFLLMGILAFVSVLLMLDIRLNFFNYVTIPITIGIGADYAINFYYRYRIEGRGKVYHTLVTTGSAVALSSLTTIIGYGTMIIANSLSLASFGLMAILGEFACVIFALLYLPAFIEYWDKKRGFVKE